MKRLFFGNLPSDCSLEEFKEWARSFNVYMQQSIDIVPGEKGQTAWAFATPTGDADAVVAVLNDREMRGHRILVRENKGL